MDDAERDHLLAHVAELDRARRRWKALALAGTPLLATLFALAAVNAVTTSLTLRDVVHRERQAREDAQRAAEEALEEAERALRPSDAAGQALDEFRPGMGEDNKQR